MATKLERLTNELEKTISQLRGLVKTREDRARSDVDHIIAAGRRDQSGLPSASARIPSADQVRIRREEDQPAEALRAVAGRDALAGGFLTSDDRMKGRTGGYTVQDVREVAKVLDWPGSRVEVRLEGARKNLTRKA